MNSTISGQLAREKESNTIRAPAADAAAVAAAAAVCTLEGEVSLLQNNCDNKSI